MKLTAIRGTLLKGLKKVNKKLILSGAALFLAALAVFSVVWQRDTDEAANELSVHNSDYAMVLQHYSGFDWSETHTAIRLNWSDGVAELENGEAHLKLRAKVYPVNLENKKINWSTSDENIAVIDAEGAVTATSPGEVTLSAHLLETDKTAEAKLTIIQPVTGLFLPTTTVKMYTTDSGILLTAMVFPKDATNTTVLWESNHSEIVSVDGSGRIKPLKAGSAVITATTEDGRYERTCHVSVSEPSIEVSEINIQNKENATVKAGEALQLTAVPKPANAKNRTPLKWESSDEMIASVSQSGRVRGESAGTALITVSSTNGIKDIIEVTVTASDAEDALDLSSRHSSYSIADGATVYTSYSITLPMMAKLQSSPKLWTSAGTRSATETEVTEYLNPNQFYTGSYKYQFLNLAQSSGVSAEALDAFLAGKGVLAGKGEVFAQAAREYGVNEVYLAAHACLESGNGTSQLATGVDYNGVKVYNVFGIGAYDSSAVASGSKRAYSMGWTSVDEAIRGGAEWISRYYINNPEGAQNTLYKMLWNPENPGTHQYATDIGWAVKQAVSMGQILEGFEGASFSYDIPVYSGMVPPVLE